jgi:hypothetical protein
MIRIIDLLLGGRNFRSLSESPATADDRSVIPMNGINPMKTSIDNRRGILIFFPLSEKPAQDCRRHKLVRQSAGSCHRISGIRTAGHVRIPRSMLQFPVSR